MRGRTLLWKRKDLYPLSAGFRDPDFISGGNEAHVVRARCERRGGNDGPRLWIDNGQFSGIAIRGEQKTAPSIGGRNTLTVSAAICTSAGESADHRDFKPVRIDEIEIPRSPRWNEDSAQRRRESHIIESDSHLAIREGQRIQAETSRRKSSDRSHKDNCKSKGVSH